MKTPGIALHLTAINCLFFHVSRVKGSAIQKSERLALNKNREIQTLHGGRKPSWRRLWHNEAILSDFPHSLRRKSPFFKRRPVIST